MNDAPALPGELQGVFIQSRVGRASIKAIDTSKAMVREWQGLQGFYKAPSFVTLYCLKLSLGVFFI